MTERLGHYDIVGELGRGGMGVVYKGYEPALGRYVAIKVLATAMAHDPVFVERFLREARAMATLNDPHIIQIYFIGQDEEQTFFVMEFIDGDSLSGWLKREGKLATGDALKILLQASQGLAAAHAEGVIHRDIKPGNIMINLRGVVKVADFGIALASNDVSSSSKLTSTGALVGTPGYLPPEVCLGKAVDQRSDIFALGIVLFESLTGRMPFDDASPLKLMLSIVESEIPDIREFNPEVDEETVRMLRKMLEKNPSDRYQSCDQLIADLQRHPLAIGPLKLRKPEDSSKATMVGVPTPQTGGHKPPRGATPLPQVGARTQPVMAQPIGRATPAPTAQSQQLEVSPPPKKSRALPIAIAAVLVLALGGYGLSRVLPFGGKTDPSPPTVVEDAAPAAAPATPAVAPPVEVAASATASNAAVAEVAAVADNPPSPAAAVPSAAASLQPAPGATPVDPAASAEITEAEVTAEVSRRQKLANAVAARERKRRMAAAAAAAASVDSTGSSDDESVPSDEGSGGASTVDAAAARRAYLCRTQRRC